MSEAEARVYVALLAHGPLTGYQVARAAAMPRPNVYPALERLERRGAVVRVPTAEGAMRYAPVPFERLAAHLEALHRERIQRVQEALARMPEAAQQELTPLALVEGYPGLLAALRQLSHSARRFLVMGLCPPEASAVGDEILAALGRGVQVTIVCLTACDPPCGHCAGELLRQPLLTPSAAAGGRRWALALRDGEEALAAEIDARGALTLLGRRPVLLGLVTGFLGCASAELLGEGSPLAGLVGRKER